MFCGVSLGLWINSKAEILALYTPVSSVSSNLRRIKWRNLYLHEVYNTTLLIEIIRLFYNNICLKLKLKIRTRRVDEVRYPSPQIKYLFDLYKIILCCVKKTHLFCAIKCVSPSPETYSFSRKTF